MSETDDRNRRVLVIDDNMAIHEDFRKILCAGFDASVLQEVRGGLFDDVDAPPPVERFDVDCADQGQTGVQMVKDAIEEGNPYALAFVDVRMPPGWDGVETIEHLWQLDRELQIVMCTAFSDHDWDQVMARLPRSEKLLVLRKPFDNIEVWQLANSLTARWSRTQFARSQFDLMARLADQRAEELQKEAEQIQHELALSSERDDA